ncbi:MAG: sulfur carrier protein ThiS [Rhodospirillaceae bacterium]|nr:sulfur carrier protein ThiS [Rhodospirillaceae bacterium]MCY4067442.1 sulfur carrier protein ThiS [Rhodospirillaceae bacterium]
MRIVLNGDPVDTAAATVRTLLDEQGIDAEARGVAVAVNAAVAPRGAWAETVLAEGDAVEIVKPFRGG